MDVAQLGFEVDTKGLTRGEKSLDRLDKAGGRVEKRGKGVGSVFSSLGGILAGVGIGALAVDTFKAASSMQSMSASLKTVMGSASGASQALSEIKEFAKTTPFDLEQSVQGFIKLKALGLDPSIASLRSYGNTASAMGKSLNQAVEAVADAATGEFERLKEFGIKAKSQGDLVTFTFQGVATTVKKEAASIEGYLQGIGNNNFGSAMADQMDTLGAQTSNLRGAFFELQLAFMGVKEGGKGLASSAGNSIKSLTKLLESDGAIAAVESLGRAFAGVIDGTIMAISGISQLYTTFRPFYEMMLNESVLFAPYRAFLALFQSSNDLVGVMDLLKGVFTDSQLVGIALVNGLLTGFEKIKGGVRIAGEAIKLAFIGSFDLVLEANSKLVNKIAEGLAIFGDNRFSEGAKNFSKEISNILTPLDNFKTAVSRINQETDTAIKTIDVITDSMADEAIATKLASKETEKATIVIVKNTKKVSENNIKLDKNSEIHRELIKDLELTTKNVSNITKRYGEYNSAADLVAETIRRNNQEQAKTKGILEELQTQYKSGQITLGEYEAANDSLGISTEKTTTIMSASWERFKDSAFNSLETFYRSGLDGTKNFSASIKDLFKDMVASILAQLTALFAANAFKKLSDYLAGNQQTTGFFDGFGSAFSGGQSGGSGGGGFTSALGQGGSAISSGVGAYNNVNQIQAGAEQGGTGGAISVATGALGLYRNGQQLLTAYQALTGASQTLSVVGGTINTTVAATQSANAALGGLNATIQGVNALPATVSAAQGAAGTSSAVAQGSGVAASGGGGLAASLGATAGWVGVGLLVDKYLNDGRVSKGFGVEFEGRKQGWKDLFDGDFSSFIKSQFTAPYESLKETFGGRSTDELGRDQLKSVFESLESGKSNAVEVGQGTRFLGGSNDETVFFESFNKTLNGEKVSALIKERLGSDDVREIAEGIFRIEDKSGSFAADHEKIVAEVMRSIAEVEIGFTDLEKTSVKSIGKTFTELDRIFDSSLESGLDTQTRMLDAISEVYNLSTSEAQKWLDNSGFAVERFEEIFNAASGDTLSQVVSDFTMATDSINQGFNGLAGNVNSSFNLIQGGLYGLTDVAISESQRIAGAYTTAVPSSIQAPALVVNNNTPEQQQKSAIDQETAAQLKRVADNLDDVTPFIRQQAASGV